MSQPETYYHPRDLVIQPKTDKVKPRYIILDRAEGLLRECGQPEVTYTWPHADQILRRMAQTAPKQSYHKVDFVVVYQNGETYSGRYDLTKQDAYKSDLLKTHIREFALCYSGLKKPSHMTDLQYREFINYYKENGSAEFYKKFLAQYEPGE